jgi:hypothetical protein
LNLFLFLSFFFSFFPLFSFFQRLCWEGSCFSFLLPEPSVLITGKIPSFFCFSTVRCIAWRFFLFPYAISIYTSFWCLSWYFSVAAAVLSVCNMTTRMKMDEKNEKAVRSLLKKTLNRRCINCNSLVCFLIL